MKLRFTTGLVIGLVVALVAGVGAYILGTATGGKPVAQPSATPSPSLGLFEANQKKLNEAKFTGELAPLAKPWLPYLGACISNTDPKGPTLHADETAHVFCLYGGVQVHFAQFKSAADTHSERALREQLNQTNGSFAPGQQAPTQKTGGVTHTQGQYVEYALKSSDGRPVCGLWWNREQASSAVYLLASCHDVLGDDWAPLRDLWQRFS